MVINDNVWKADFGSSALFLDLCICGYLKDDLSRSLRVWICLKYLVDYVLVLIYEQQQCWILHDIISVIPR